MCGWHRNKFGLSWQIAPNILSEMLHEISDKSKRVMHAMRQMNKIEIEVLK
jgi:predicted 3-demethylubiquinone-9 3-methyltransferase (glyoxalase superfamily)